MQRRMFLRLSILLVVLLAAILFCDLAIADADSFRLKSAEMMDKTLDFLIALSLALFAIVGYFLKSGLSESACARIWQVGALILFVVADCLSLFFGYRARLDLTTILASGGFPLNSVSTWYELQAISVLASGLLAFILVGMALAWPAKPPAGGG